MDAVDAHRGVESEDGTMSAKEIIEKLQAENNELREALARERKHTSYIQAAESNYGEMLNALRNGTADATQQASACRTICHMVGSIKSFQFALQGLRRQRDELKARLGE